MKRWCRHKKALHKGIRKRVSNYYCLFLLSFLVLFFSFFFSLFLFHPSKCRPVRECCHGRLDPPSPLSVRHCLQTPWWLLAFGLLSSPSHHYEQRVIWIFARQVTYGSNAPKKFYIKTLILQHVEQHSLVRKHNVDVSFNNSTR